MVKLWQPGDAMRPMKDLERMQRSGNWATAYDVSEAMLAGVLPVTLDNEESYLALLRQGIDPKIVAERINSF